MNPHNDDDHRFTPSRSDVFVLSAIEAGKLFAFYFWLIAVGQSFCAFCNRLTDWEPVDRFSRWLFLVLALAICGYGLFEGGRQVGEATRVSAGYDPMSAARPTTYYETVSRLEGMRR